MTSILYDCIVKQKAHHAYRRTIPETLSETFAAESLSPEARMTRRFELLCQLETPVFLPEERICFLRTIKNLPPIFTEQEWAALSASHFIHELGFHSNLCANYGKILSKGLLAFRDQESEYGRRSIDALLGLVKRYQLAAEQKGLTDIAQTLRQVPAYGARSFREALQSLRILSFGLWLEGNYHNTLGRVDQYLYPYLKQDLDAGIVTAASALDLVEEFFLSCNRDSDLYPGVQQGDNGQSLMLGGSREAFNLLSELCLTASRNLKLIDPKINVRVDKHTPDEIYTLCTQLTKEGLGFPQYSNDDVVIPGLCALGYAPADAANYTVAACWEFIIPGVGGDIPNIAALSMPKVIDTCLHRDLPDCKTWEQFLAAVSGEIHSTCASICNGIRDVWFVPSPFGSVLMDYPEGQPKYANFGIHGVGLSTAADSMAAIERHIFTEKALSPQQLIAAVDSDFAHDPALLHTLRYETPKLGCGGDAAEPHLQFLLDCFSNSLRGRKNCLGGCWRAGTGSAMYYLWFADELGASPDGRRKGEPFAANYSVSLFAQPDGPFSVLRSMTRPDLQKTINGGPLTLELHSSVFQTEQSVKQVGQLVKQYIQMGGHQIQLNAVNAETLRDAQKHPEKYPQLIVRIWGWSAYFVELDKAYQDHVIARQEYGL